MFAFFHICEHTPCLTGLDTDGTQVMGHITCVPSVSLLRRPLRPGTYMGKPVDGDSLNTPDTTKKIMQGRMGAGKSSWVAQARLRRGGDTQVTQPTCSVK